ncbi:DUF4942 domain-containing protein [Rickettsiales bacterium]|nr:DUF4942 domain-containing protein [Rickettsiales bacterium]
MNINKIVTRLKEEDQDFEFYPTTDLMIDKINQDLKYGSILDIGCGNGETLMKLEASPKYGIEKSQILLDHANPDIIVLGRDFHNQQLIDKKIGNIFCNPPYSEFKTWMIKIIKESNCDHIYFIVPKRWRNDQEINDIIKRRNLSDHSLGCFNFFDAPRKARAEVEIVKLSFNRSSSYKDPFDLFFEETFKFNIKENEKIYFSDKVKKHINNALIKGDDVIKTLEQCYNIDLQNLLNNYRKLEDLDHEIFIELDINLTNIKKALKLKIENLKTIYWQELFEKLDKLTDRLTYNNRDYISSKIINIVDFNLDNIYSIVIWAIKNTNKYIDKQLVDLFYDLTDQKNIRNYKSNQKTWQSENWRYIQSKKEHSHYILDYRIILQGHSGNIRSDYDGVPYPEGELNNCYYSGSSAAYRILNDIRICARNLGIIFDPIPTTDWEYGKARILRGANMKIFATVKLFKNGNIHIKFNQEFIKKLNIEVARLKKWINSPKDAEQEMDNITEFEANHYYDRVMKIEKNLKLLT